MDITTPVSGSHDGWTAESASASPPSEADIRQALGAPAPTAEELAAQAAVAAEADAATAAAAATAEEAAEVAAEGDQGDAVAGTGESEPPVVAEGAPVQKKRSPQARIDQATARQRQAEDALLVERTERKREQEEFNRRLAALETGKPAATVTTPEATPAAAADPAALIEPVWETYDAEGKSWAEFSKDHAAFVRADATAAAIKATNERLDAARKSDDETRQTAEQKAAVNAAMDRLQTRLDAIRAKQPDFDALVKQHLEFKSPLLDVLVPHSEAGADLMLHLATHPEEAAAVAAMRWRGSPDLPRPIVEALRMSDVTVKLLSHFATHPDEFQALQTMHPVVAMKRLGQLEAHLASPSGSMLGAPAVTKAKPPLRPVGGAAHIASTGSDPKDEDLVAYIERENAREKEVAPRFAR